MAQNLLFPRPAPVLSPVSPPSYERSSSTLDSMSFRTTSDGTTTITPALNLSGGNTSGAAAKSTSRSNSCLQEGNDTKQPKCRIQGFKGAAGNAGARAYTRICLVHREIENARKKNHVHVRKRPTKRREVERTQGALSTVTHTSSLWRC